MLSPCFPKIHLSNKNILRPPSVWNSWTTHRVHTKPIFTSSQASLSPHTCNSYYRSIVTTQCAQWSPTPLANYFVYFSENSGKKQKKGCRGYKLMKHKWTATLKISFKLLAFQTELLTCFITIDETRRSRVYSSLMISKNGLICKAGYLSMFYCFMGKRRNPQIKFEYNFMVKLNIKQWKFNNTPIIRNDSSIPNE